MKELKRFKFNWVLVNKIAIGSIPYSINDIDILLNNKIKTILTLCNEKEDPKIYKNDLKINIQRYEIPDHRCKTLPKIEDIEKILDLISFISKDGPVFIHCFASKERAPLVCLAWLVKKENLQPNEALAYLMHIHPGTSPLPEQLRLIEYL